MIRQTTMKQRAIFSSFALISLVLIALVAQQHTPTGKLTYISYDMCEHKRLVETALQHQLNYRMDSTFDAPAIYILGDRAHIHAIQDDPQPPSTHSAHKSTHTSCHLTHAKYNSEHVNPKLTAFIPDDVDYVSYAPPHIKQDKAVYCYYEFDNQRFDTPKATSTCYFIHLQDNRLITEDISDLERLHLQIVAYHHRDGLFNPYSHVYEWHDKAHLRYGITFHTKVNNWYHGYAGIY